MNKKDCCGLCYEPKKYPEMSYCSNVSCICHHTSTSKWEKTLEDILVDVCDNEKCGSPYEHKDLKNSVRNRLKKLINDTLATQKKEIEERIKQRMSDLTRAGSDIPDTISTNSTDQIRYGQYIELRSVLSSLQ